jgi:hypothetical protein
MLELRSRKQLLLLARQPRARFHQGIAAILNGSNHSGFGMICRPLDELTPEAPASSA